MIRRVAKELSQRADIIDEEGYRDHVERLCIFAYDSKYALRRRASASGRGPTQRDADVDFQCHLLADAALLNYTSVIQELLDQGVDPTVSTHMFSIPMQMVAKYGNLELLEMFLSEYTAGKFYRKWLYAARGASSSANGGITVLKMLLDPRWGHKPLNHHWFVKCMVASLCRTPGIASFLYLLDIAASFTEGLNIPVVIYHALNSRSLEKVRYLLTISSLKDKQSLHPCASPLRPAIELGSVELVKMLLEAGADPREGAESKKYHPADAFQEAASRGYLSLVGMLLDYGADVNAGMPPAIVLAVQVEHTEMFRLLRRRGAVLDTDETGGEAMRRAKVEGLLLMERLLVNEGCLFDGKGFQPVVDRWLVPGRNMLGFCARPGASQR